jgi:hypothetical protein
VKGRAYSHYGGKSIIIQPPQLGSRDDFLIWLRGIDSLVAWVKVELDDREQVYFAEIDLGTSRKYRRELWRALGIRR